MTDHSIQALADLLLQSERIAVLTGAGMSTESGIPDFRSANGLWTKDMTLAEAISIDYFRYDPRAFWTSFKDIFSIKMVGHFQPNKGHAFIAWLEEIGKQVTVLTQNIDGLHQQAGSRNVVELHGTLLTASCPACGAVHGLDYIKAHDVPECNVCREVIKPDVVLYGEAVPHIEFAMECATQADCLMVLGSSLEVSPVNYIPVAAVENNVPAALINLTGTRLDRLFKHRIAAGIGQTCETLRQAIEQSTG